MIISQSSHNHITIISLSSHNHLTIISSSTFNNLMVNHLTILISSSYNHLLIILKSSYYHLNLIIKWPVQKVRNQMRKCSHTKMFLRSFVSYFVNINPDTLNYPISSPDLNILNQGRLIEKGNVAYTYLLVNIACLVKIKLANNWRSDVQTPFPPCQIFLFKPSVWRAPWHSTWRHSA